VEREEDDTTSFTAEDFPGTGQLEAFCSVLERDRIIAPEDPCSLGVLEGLLRSRDLNERLGAVRPLEPRPARSSGSSGCPRATCPRMIVCPPQHRTRLRILNRSLLELAYPGICPAHVPYGLTPENYVFLGIKHRVVRRVFHVLPDDAWAEVEGNLERIPHAVPRGKGYRVTANDGVPVDILRIGDLPPIGEPVIVHVNTDVWLPDELDAIAGMVRNGGIVPDMLTASGREAERFLQEARRER
jgi:hypothetical protein